MMKTTADDKQLPLTVCHSARSAEDVFHPFEIHPSCTPLLCEGPSHHSLLLPEKLLFLSQTNQLASPPLPCQEETECLSPVLPVQLVCPHRSEQQERILHSSLHTSSSGSCAVLHQEHFGVSYKTLALVCQHILPNDGAITDVYDITKS